MYRSQRSVSYCKRKLLHAAPQAKGDRQLVYNSRIYILLGFKAISKLAKWEALNVPLSGIFIWNSFKNNIIFLKTFQLIFSTRLNGFKFNEHLQVVAVFSSSSTKKDVSKSWEVIQKVHNLMRLAYVTTIFPCIISILIDSRRFLYYSKTTQLFF